jgi:hypothetical protein
VTASAADTAPRATGRSPACRADYRPFEIPAHQTHMIQVTLWKDLPGLAPVKPGRYVLDKPVHYRPDRRFDDPRDTGTTGAIVLTYDVPREAERPGSSSTTTAAQAAGSTTCPSAAEVAARAQVFFVHAVGDGPGQ